MGDYLALDAAAVEQQINWLISEYPEMAEDEALRADMIEGETGLKAVLSRAVSHRQEASEVLVGIKARKQDITERQHRYERRKEALTALIKRLMDAAGVASMTLPEATLSMSRGRESVDIIDLDALPQGYYTTERKADKDALYKAIKAGEYIPGAGIVRAVPSLVVRTK